MIDTAAEKLCLVLIRFGGKVGIPQTSLTTPVG